MATDRSRSAGWCARSSNRLLLQSLVVFKRLRSDVGGIRSPKAATTSRGCGRRVLRRRWRWRHWWPRRRFATPRPLEFSVTIRSPPTRDCNLDLLIAALRPRLSASQAESHVGWTTAWSGAGGRRALIDDGPVALGSPGNVSSACGLARSPSVHFASASVHSPRTFRPPRYQ